MSLYSEWQAIADVERTPGEAKKFWKEYFALETENYKTILENYQHTYSSRFRSWQRSSTWMRSPSWASWTASTPA